MLATQYDCREVSRGNRGGLEKQKIIGYGVGPKKMSEHFVYIALFTKHMNLGFYYGSTLDDPSGRLEGTGKKLRHVKVRSGDDIDTELGPLLERSIIDIKARSST